MRALILAVVVTLLSACASTGPAAPGAAAADAASAPRLAEKRDTVASKDSEEPGYWDEIVCKREQVTGTRLTRGRCHSRYDWARMRGAATETMRDIESQPRPCLDGAGCGGGG